MFASLKSKIIKLTSDTDPSDFYKLSCENNRFLLQDKANNILLEIEPSDTDIEGLNSDNVNIDSKIKFTQKVTLQNSSNLLDVNKVPINEQIVRSSVARGFVINDTHPMITQDDAYAVYVQEQINALSQEFKWDAGIWKFAKLSAHGKIQKLEFTTPKYRELIEQNKNPYFQLFSVSKLTTASVILNMFQDFKSYQFAMTESIAKYLPEFSLTSLNNKTTYVKIIDNTAENKCGVYLLGNLVNISAIQNPGTFDVQNDYLPMGVFKYPESSTITIADDEMLDTYPLVYRFITPDGIVDSIRFNIVPFIKEPTVMSFGSFTSGFVAGSFVPELHYYKETNYLQYNPNALAGFFSQNAFRHLLKDSTYVDGTSVDEAYSNFNFSNRPVSGFTRNMYIEKMVSTPALFQPNEDFFYGGGQMAVLGKFAQIIDSYNRGTLSNPAAEREFWDIVYERFYKKYGIARTEIFPYTVDNAHLVEVEERIRPQIHYDYPYTFQKYREVINGTLVEIFPQSSFPAGFKSSDGLTSDVLKQMIQHRADLFGANDVNIMGENLKRKYTAMARCFGFDTYKTDFSENRWFVGDSTLIATHDALEKASDLMIQGKHIDNSGNSVDKYLNTTWANEIMMHPWNKNRLNDAVFKGIGHYQGRMTGYEPSNVVQYTFGSYFAHQPAMNDKSVERNSGRAVASHAGYGGSFISLDFDTSSLSYVIRNFNGSGFSSRIHSESQKQVDDILSDLFKYINY